MARRSSVPCLVMFLGVLAVGGVYGCGAVTGHKPHDVLADFLTKTVVPLWQHGFQADPPEPDDLEWMRTSEEPVR